MLDKILAKGAQIDIHILYAVNQYHIRSLDWLFVFISDATTYVSISLILSLLIVSVYRHSNPIRKRFYQLCIVFALSAITSFILKSTIMRTRPFIRYSFIEKLSTGGNSSFPSGHTLEAFAMATAFTLLLPKKKKPALIFLWASLVAYSRMELGVHYPSDVFTGMVLGAFIGIIVCKGFRQFSLNNSYHL